jgi:hypothetical protein
MMHPDDKNRLAIIWNDVTIGYIDLTKPILLSVNGIKYDISTILMTAYNYKDN